MRYPCLKSWRILQPAPFLQSPRRMNWEFKLFDRPSACQQISSKQKPTVQKNNPWTFPDVKPFGINKNAFASRIPFSSSMFHQHVRGSFTGGKKRSGCQSAANGNSAVGSCVDERERPGCGERCNTHRPTHTERSLCMNICLNTHSQGENMETLCRGTCKFRMGRELGDPWFEKYSQETTWTLNASCKQPAFYKGELLAFSLLARRGRLFGSLWENYLI